METSTQRSVCPLLTQPPNFVNKVCPSMLKWESDTSSLLSKIKKRTIIDGPSDVCKNLEVYIFLVQDGLRPNSQLWMYNGLNNALIRSSFWLGKLNFLLQIFLGFVSKTGGVHPISFVKRSTRSFRAHLLYGLFSV